MFRRELGGVDVFHLVRDREMRARGLPGNHCLFVVELAGRVDERALERRILRGLKELPELRSRLQNGFPPRWVEDPEASFRLGFRSNDVPVDDLLAERLDGAFPWALDVVRGKARDTIVFRWFHPLADGKAAERIVRHLGSMSDDRGEDLEAPPPMSERSGSAERPIQKLTRQEKIAAMRGYNRHIVALAKAPILSLGAAHNTKQKLGKTRSIRIELSEEETARFDRRVREVAKLAETSLMLIAATRALDSLLATRGFAPSHALIPVPLSLDPKAQATRLFGNNLTMMMFQIRQGELGDERNLVARIAEQQRAIVRQKLDVGMLAALDLARWLPSPVYRAIERGPTGGEIASLFVSNPGTVTIERFAGIPVENAYPLPAVVIPPGAQVIFTRFRRRLTAILVYVEGALLPAEAPKFASLLRSELLPL